MNDNAHVGFVKEGSCTWNPAQANAVFNRYRYSRNRNENKAQAHIDALARQMKDGSWLSRSPLDFARLPDGSLTLVNGHHRLIAQVKSGRNIEWLVIIHDCEDADEVANLFWRFDTVLRKRSVNNMLAGVNAAENLGLGRMTAASLAKTVTFIDNGMRPPLGQNTRTYTPSEKLALMAEWQAEAADYEKAVDNSPASIRRKLYIAQVMAVALVTIRANRESAVEFWSGIAADDGLNRGDPRKTLLDFLRDTHGTSTGFTATAVACARAWAAWEQKRDLGMIRVGRAPIRIHGTSVVVTP